MFEKEAEEYYSGQYDAWLEGEDSFALEEEIEQAFKDGAEFGYNKANEWHYIKDGDLPGEDTEREKVYAIFKNNSYHIVSRAAVKNYEDLIAWTEFPVFIKRA